MAEKFYVSLDVVQRELERRLSLRDSVEDWLLSCGFPVPEFLSGVTGPIGCFPRQVATWRYEDVVFSLLAQRAGVTPVWLEYAKDIFTHLSSYKRGLLKIRFCSGRGRNRGLRVRAVKLACPEYWHKKEISSIVTGDGRKLIDVHHELQDQSKDDVLRFDVSDWLKSIGPSAGDYYRIVFALCISHFVIFETFHDGESGKVVDSLTDSVIYPAADEISSLFGFCPLVVRMPWFFELALYPEGDWRKHDIIPPEYVE